MRKPKRGKQVEPNYATSISLGSKIQLFVLNVILTPFNERKIVPDCSIKN